jgi:hypothetical protein
MENLLAEFTTIVEKRNMLQGKFLRKILDDITKE